MTVRTTIRTPDYARLFPSPDPEFRIHDSHDVVFEKTVGPVQPFRIQVGGESIYPDAGDIVRVYRRRDAAK